MYDVLESFVYIGYFLFFIFCMGDEFAHIFLSSVVFCGCEFSCYVVWMSGDINMSNTMYDGQ